MARTSGKKTKRERILELVAGEDLQYHGRYAAVAREVGVSRSYVGQVVEAAGGEKVLNIQSRRKVAEGMLRRGRPISEVRKATGYSRYYLYDLQRGLDVWLCSICGKPRERFKHYCKECRNKQRLASMRRQREKT